MNNFLINSNGDTLFPIREGSSSLEGKTFAAFGDSITEFVYNGKGWLEHASEIYGCNMLRCAVGGSHIESAASLSTDIASLPVYQRYDWLSIYRIIEAIKNQDFTGPENAVNFLASGGDDNSSQLETWKILSETRFRNVDGVIIMAGTNGFSSANKGTLNWNDYDCTKQFSAMNASIKMLLETAPHLAIYIVTPPPRYGNGLGENWTEWDDSLYSDHYENGVEPPIITLVNGLKEICRINNVTCIDLHHNLGINRYTFSDYFNSSTDGIHPLLGLKRIAKCICSGIISSNTLR